MPEEAPIAEEMAQDTTASTEPVTIEIWFHSGKGEERDALNASSKRSTAALPRSKWKRFNCVVNRFGWLDSYHVQIIPFIANALSIFLFYQFFINLPKDLEEAALVDGAGFLRIYWSIFVPLSRPVFATVAILQFILRWGEFLWPLMVTRVEQYRPLPLALQQFFSQDPKMWGDIMAFAAMMTVPVLIIFLLFQKWFVQSVATTGVKG
ncbi:MAG: carbohydrate ABC transporter permease [Anaerolineae bacterium]|nr:carbohydrate ABC transporter permease [Anaerolineae bacterium]